MKKDFPLKVIILAAGQSKRMKTDISKVLHPLAGVPLLKRVVDTAQQLSPQTIYVVYNNGKVREKLKDLPVQWIEQPQQLGTGHAVSEVLPKLNDQDRILVLYGDVPLITVKTLQKLLTDTPKDALGILVVDRNNPFGYGRIIRKSGKIIAIIEEKDATQKQRAIREINTGILTASAKHLKQWLPKVTNKNSQKEYYLTDVIAIAAKAKNKIIGIKAETIEETQGVNDRAELAILERYYQQQTAKQLMLQGVTIIDPNRFDLRGEIHCAQDVVIDCNVILEGKINIGTGSKIGAGTILKNVTIGENVEILPYCVIEDSIIGNNCKIGPLARVRPGCVIKNNVELGNFIELKKTQMGDNSKAHHHGYLGDSIIGENVNVGAGVITCNYDGANKYQTIIKDGAFIGSDSQLVAPVTINENAYIGSGSTITKDAPANKLTLGRAKQVTIENWKPPQKNLKDKQ